MDESITKDFDIFFYYGLNNLSIETQSDIMCNLMQPKRSLFYDRAHDAAGIQDYENFPDGLGLRVNLPYDIVNSMSKRNQVVSNGENGARDRRVAVSQSTIRIESEGKGNVGVTVLYIPLADYKQADVNLSLGVKA